MTNIIEVTDLSKKYILSPRRRNNTLRDTFADLFAFKKERRVPDKVLWALRDVSFEIADGEKVGIVGNNGAGKSTLLKILTQIIRPSSGEVILRGRVGSLLEIGTGFHQELSGRENIYLNGSVLGMKRAEIEKKFDEIVAFAEVEEFLDAPLKFYSTGMFMRLAFAIAANLEPDILIVDEVLAVGDIAFQKRCLNKMREISEHGRTVIFVSHDLESIAQLCSRGIWLENGAIREDSNARDVADNYYLSSLESNLEPHPSAARSGA